MDLKDLYRDVIVDHNRHPRNFGKLDPADAHAEGFNPLCGDKLSIYVNLDGERISEAKFEGSGCAISVASASLLTEAVKGKSRAEVQKLFDDVHTVLTHHDANVDAACREEALGGGEDARGGGRDRAVSHRAAPT